jgi:hypothetical protein
MRFSDWLKRRERFDEAVAAPSAPQPRQRPNPAPFGTTPDGEPLVKTPDGKLMRQSDVPHEAWREIGQVLMNNADGFAKNKIDDPWKNHPGFRTLAINILKKWGLDKNREAVDKIFGPQGLYYNGGGGFSGNPLAFIRKKIQDPTAFGNKPKEPTPQPQPQPQPQPVPQDSGGGGFLDKLKSWFS